MHAFELKNKNNVFLKKMRNLKSGIAAVLSLLSLTACIREEAPNAEADILTCVVPGEVLKTDPEIENETVTLTVNGAGRPT